MLIELRIDKEKIINNIEKIREINNNIICVLKDDAYGLGIENVLPVVLSQNIDKVAVAFMDEALKVKKIISKYDRLKTSIITLNYVEKEMLQTALNENIEITIYSLSQLNEYINYIKQEICEIKIHIKLNTGMNRLGFDFTDIEELIRIITNNKLQIESIFSHISNAENNELTESQVIKFESMLQIFNENKITYGYTHIQASPLLFKGKSKYNYDYARVGMAIYGLQPLSTKVKLENPIKLVSKVVHIRNVKKGEVVSYGNKNMLQRETKIAIVPIGYAHGIQKQIEKKKSYVLIRGEKAYILGEICMDMILVDVTDIENISIHDEVVIIGEQGKNNISLLKMANWAGTIQDDVITKLDKNIRRI